MDPFFSINAGACFILFDAYKACCIHFPIYCEKDESREKTQKNKFVRNKKTNRHQYLWTVDLITKDARNI
jgi:hypothetical protein